MRLRASGVQHTFIAYEVITVLTQAVRYATIYHNEYILYEYATEAELAIFCYIAFGLREPFETNLRSGARRGSASSLTSGLGFSKGFRILNSA